MKLTFKNKIILLFCFVILGMIVSVVVSERNKLAVEKSNRWVERTQEVFKKSGQLESLIQYNLLASRGYIISGDSIFIGQTEIANKDLKKELDHLSFLINDDTKQVVRLEYLKKLIGRQILFSVKVQEQLKNKGFSVAQNLIILRETKEYIDQVKKSIAAIQQAENRLLKQRQEDYLKSSIAFYRSFYFLLVFIAVLFFITVAVVKYNFKIKKQVEDALFVKNEWYNQTMASLGWGVVTIDLNGIITFSNRVAYELSGWGQEKVIGEVIEEVFEIHNGKKRLKVMKPLIKAVLENKILKLGTHTILKRKNNSEIFIDVCGAPIHNQNKEIIGGVLLFRDVSENKKVELALLASLQEIKDYKYALDESSIVAITNQKGVIKHINDNFCKISKYSREELIGQDHRIINSGQHPKEFIRELWTTISNGKIWRGEIENRSKDGTLYWVDTTIVPFLNDEGKPYQYIAIRSDITERKQAEENFLTLANNMSQLAWMADADGSIFWYNQRWFDYSGTTLEDMKGWGWQKVHHPDHLQRVVDKIKRCFEVGEVWEDTFPLRGTDGRYCWFLSRAVPIRDANGTVIRWFGTNTDTTEQKEAEEKLVEYQHQLEIKVEERTKDLVDRERMLEMQNKELNKTNSELDRFVYSTSHDLRAPLKSMLGLIGIVKEREESSNIDQIKRLEMLNKSVVRLDAFIGDILNYSRNTRVDVVKEEIDFGEMIQEIRSNHKFIEGANELKLQVEIRQTEKFISDKRRINVILNNLISNAIKYKDGNKEASFVTTLIECDSENGIITIEDNGIGIAEDKQEKVFEMFYRGTKLSTGSGLGMYIVKETLEKLGGGITLKSELNIGTKFIIQIPNQNKHLDYLEV
jgi:PAS domain S-box-containing protein